MKKIITWLITLSFVFVSWNIAIMESSTIDFTNMTYQELAELESKIENVLLSTILLDDTTLPIGKYVAGDDIPSGSYVITAISAFTSPRLYIKLLNSDEVVVESYEMRPNTFCKVTLKDGMIMTINESQTFEITIKIRTLNSFLVNSKPTNPVNSNDDITESNGSLNLNTNISTESLDQNKLNSIYTYQDDGRNLYKATVLSDTVIKIDNWYRVIATDESPFYLDHSVMTIVTTDDSSDFQWLDENNIAFRVTMKDAGNNKFQESKLVVFTKGD